MQELTLRFTIARRKNSNREQHFDEGWIYNCLQHVDDPNKVMAMLLRSADSVRIFEWIDLPVCEGHPHTLRAEQFERWLPADQWTYSIWNVGELRLNGNGAFESLHRHSRNAERLRCHGLVPWSHHVRPLHIPIKARSDATALGRGVITFSAI